MENLKTCWRLLMVVMFAVIVASCSDDDSDDPSPSPEAQKSGAKAIASFKFSALSPEVTGTIAEADKKITATILKGTDVTALVPTITISEKATIAPASGVSQNFTNPVKYTVTAEDGTKQEYTVTVTVSQTVTFAITSVSAEAPAQGDVYKISGSGFGAYANNKMVVHNDETGKESTWMATAQSTATELYFNIPDDFETGIYSATLYIGTQSLALDIEISIVPGAPVIISATPTLVAAGHDMVITGKNFAVSGNEVSLIDVNRFSFPCEVVAESATSITIIVPQTMVKGNHTLAVHADGRDTEFSQPIVVGPIPQVESINKTTFARGETIILTGKNLRAESSIMLTLWPTVGTQQRYINGTVNEAGTEATFKISATMPVDEYDLALDIDGEEVSGIDIKIAITE